MSSAVPQDLRNTTGAINVVFDSRLSYKLPDDTSQNYLDFLAVPVEQRLTNIGRIDLQSVGVTLPPHNLNNTNNSIMVAFDVVNSEHWEQDIAAGVMYTTPAPTLIQVPSMRVDSSNMQVVLTDYLKNNIVTAYGDWLTRTHTAALARHGGSNDMVIWMNAIVGQLGTISTNFTMTWESLSGQITASSSAALLSVGSAGDNDSHDKKTVPYTVVRIGMASGDTTRGASGKTVVGINDPWTSFFGWNDWRDLNMASQTGTAYTSPGGLATVTQAPVNLLSFNTFLVRQPSLAVGTSNNFYDSNHDAIGRSLPPDTFFTFDVGGTLPGEEYTEVLDKNSNNTWFYPSGLDLKSLFPVSVTNIYGQKIDPAGFQGSFRMNLKCYPM